VHRRRRRLQIPYQAEVRVRLRVKLEAELGAPPPLRPVASLLRRVRACTPRGLQEHPGSGGDEGGVLDHALPHLQPPLVQLTLQLLPDQPVPARLGEALPELPHRRVVRRLLREPEEPLEAKAVVHLPLQLQVAQPVPLLEHEELRHHHLVHVGPASPRGVVAVDGLYDGSEGLPVYEFVDAGEPVAVLPDVLVGLSQHIGPECGHVCLWGCHDL